ncbi:uncharacterized protein MELLADRAFT_105405 [Melampsora larici-populina 98AG31]|uniref:Uncharacterized protein n=1 Tax=Melampsora larici-populina (strain 98AG31 / pathotype 3-4-7) TaxID=747676 RepID=F4RI15_MELLP|nr:uncharacterized protein MELLADRAFT_105405 [Melampsora larici-populina 98AG31]EGG07918.1 hypothetical protein MELLADRAFT_105405 [Melampsora larici-populina 98AG31]
MTQLTAKISAILTATSDVRQTFPFIYYTFAFIRATLLRLRLPDGSSAWHKSKTKLILKGVRGQPMVCPLKAYGLLMADDVLIRGQTYHIHGPVGVDPVGGAFIKHSYITQSLVATVPPRQAELAEKAYISSTGRVLRVAWDNVNDDGDWHLTVEAEHDIFDPEVSVLVKPFVSYCFLLNSFISYLGENRVALCDNLSLWAFFSGVIRDGGHRSEHRDDVRRPRCVPRPGI